MRERQRQNENSRSDVRERWGGLLMTDFVKALRRKGWSAKEVAGRWGLLPRQLSRIGNSPKQIHLDALAGLPDRGKRETKRLR